MYLTLHLILSHFLADYPMQPGKLVKFKFKSVYGVFVHAVVQLIVLLIILFPFIYSNKAFIAIGIIFITHGIIDFVKIYFDKKYKKLNKLLLYILDQSLHLSIILILSYAYIGKIIPSMTGWWVKYFTDNSVISFVLILTLVTYFYDVTKWTYLNSVKPMPYKRDYKMMARNAIIVVIAFLLYWLTR